MFITVFRTVMYEQVLFHYLYLNIMTLRLETTVVDL